MTWGVKYSMNYGKAFGVYPPAVPGIGAGKPFGKGFGKFPFVRPVGKFGKCGKPFFGCI
jgi:hypothetical protein